MSEPLLPLLVFLAELAVVTLSTIRIIFLSRGRKAAATILGFFEITLWLFAIGQIMQNLRDVGCYLGFAAGFTIGNFLGVLIEKRLGLGTLLVRIITGKNATPLVWGLQANDYGVTLQDGQGTRGPVKVVFSVIRRKELSNVLRIIRDFDPQAFYAVDEIQSVGPSCYPAASKREGDLLEAAPGAVFGASRDGPSPEPCFQGSLSR